MNETSFYDILDPVSLGSAGLQWEIRLDRTTAFMPPGHNGPYKDLESPLRNTAHWLVTFSILWSLSAETEFRDIGHRLTNYLLSDTAHYSQGALVNRQKPGKDWCNGTIGYAWVIEALTRAAWYLGRHDASHAALRLAMSLPFDSSAGLWKATDPIRSKAHIDATYNHQSWLAAAMAELGGAPSEQVSCFVDKSLERHFRVDADGLIDHHVAAENRKPISVERMLSTLTKKLDPYAQGRKRYDQQVEPRARAVGYHLYVLFSLARLYPYCSEHAFFASKSFRAALRFAASTQFRNELSRSPFSYDYNPPGFEYLLIVMTFGHLEPTLTMDIWAGAFERQKKKSYCNEMRLFSRASDPATVAARVYEVMMGLEGEAKS